MIICSIVCHLQLALKHPEAQLGLCVIRYDYEMKMNTIQLQLHFEEFYTYSEGMLQPRDQACCFLELSIDRRKAIAELRQAVVEVRVMFYLRSLIVNK